MGDFVTCREGWVVGRSGNVCELSSAFSLSCR